MIAAAFAALTLAATCVPVVDRPTPTVSWDQPGATDQLRGYELAYCQPGGVPNTLVDIPCEWADIDGDGVDETRFCRGLNAPLPLQRYCATCQPFNAYEFYVRGIAIDGRRTTYTLPVTICFSPIVTLRPQ